MIGDLALAGSIQAVGVLLPVLYLVTAGLYGMHFGGRLAPQVQSPRRVMVGLTVGAHALYFALQSAAVDGFPITDPWTTTSSVALALALIYLVTAGSTPDVGAGTIVFVVVALLVLAASAFGPLGPVEPGPESEVVDLLHALTSIAAVAALILSGLHGSLYLFVLRLMQKQSFGPAVEGLPDLRTLALLTRRAALVGFLLMTVGINVGIGWAHYADVPGFHYTDLWVLILIALWLHFGLVAFSRVIPGFSARRASMAAAIGLSFFLAAGLVSLTNRSFHWAQ